jgi:hypothetical protein
MVPHGTGRTPSKRDVSNLGCAEWENGRLDRAVKHFIIAAKLGHDGSLYALKEGYKDGIVSKEDFASALRAHQAAVNATKSPQREEAEAFHQQLMAAKSNKAFWQKLMASKGKSSTAELG